MVEIPVEKKSSFGWLWALLVLLLLGLLLWWLLADNDNDEVMEPAPTAAVGTAAGEPVTDIAPLLGPNAAELVGREVQLQGVPVQDVQDGQALLVGPGAGSTLLVMPQGASIPEGLTAGNEIDVVGTVQQMEALGTNRPALAEDASSQVFIAASSITAAGEPAGTAEATAPAGTGTPPNAETVAAANRQALQRIRNNPDATPRVYFAWDSAELTSGAQAVLDHLIQSRTDARTGGITLVGFADRSGPRPYNRDLSERRAESVRRYLSGRGVGENLINVEAEGETPTLVETGDGKREPLNRRVRVELSDAP